MSFQNLEQHPRRHVPIRINHSLYERFTVLSKRTKIPMSTIARDALERHISDIETRGITTVLDEMSEVTE